MALRKIKLTVGSVPINRARTWSYPNSDEKIYEIPTYELKVVGTNSSGVQEVKTYEVFRFGVQRKSASSPPSVVGWIDPQSHTIYAWLPHYKVHSDESTEMGAWQIKGDWLIHDGPNDPRNPPELYASIGCIEICGGPNGFDRFNDDLIAWSGSTKPTRGEQLLEIGKAGILEIEYLAAKYPPLKEWTGP